MYEVFIKQKCQSFSCSNLRISWFLSFCISINGISLGFGLMTQHIVEDVTRSSFEGDFHTFEIL